MRYLRLEGSEAVQRFIVDFGFSAIVTAVHRWHARFRESLSLPSLAETVLCAFTSVSDRLVDQNELNVLVDWAAERLGLSRAALLARAAQRAGQGVNGQGSDLTVEVFDLIDLLAALLYFFELPPGLKPVVRHQVLREQLDDLVSSLPPGRVRRVLGGAAAITAEVLTELRCGLVALYTLYHSSEQAAEHQPGVRRLVIQQDAVTVGVAPASEPGSFEFDRQIHSHPTSASTIFSYDAGFVLGPARALLTDRVILRHPPRSNGPPPWSDILLHSSVASLPWTLPRGADDWPWLPGFFDWWVEGKTLHLSFVDASRLRRLAAEYRCLVLSGIGPGIFVSGASEPLRRMVASELAAQLCTLADAGCRLHLELGGSIGRHERLEPFFEALGGSIYSLGLNDVELMQLSRAACPGDLTSARDSRISQRWRQALALAERLSLERLYVHGNDADLILRRNGTREALQAEVTADLFAKGVVVLSILQRSGFAWQERARHLAPVLLGRGFEALIELVSELAAECDTGYAAHQLEAFLDSGLWLMAGSGKHALAVVPVMWPALPRSIHPGGAGDICSGVSFVYGGVKGG
ncbi:MAG: hypothetical protein ACOYZ7_01885 [Chloroflexota bacterium]